MITFIRNVWQIGDASSITSKQTHGVCSFFLIQGDCIIQGKGQGFLLQENLGSNPIVHLGFKLSGLLETNFYM